MRVSVVSVVELTRDTLSRVGVDDTSIGIIIDTILFADRRGNTTHGVGRLPLYIRKIIANHLNPIDEVRVVSDLGGAAILDARNGFGQVAGYRAMSIAMEKAKKHGISLVGVRNSNNFGMAGYYGDMAAQQGYAAIVFANAAPAIAPTGGNKTIFGTNPLCMAFPGTGELFPIVLDMATTVAARGKIRLAAKNGKKIPFDWAIGPDGNPTDDPYRALEGALLPVGGHKGYGLSMFVDLFAGMLTGSPYAGGIKNLSDMEHDSGNGHMFVALDVGFFLSGEELAERLLFFHEAVKRCGSPGKVLMPGERGYLSSEVHDAYVELSSKHVEEINAVAEEVGSLRRLEIE